MSDKQMSMSSLLNSIEETLYTSDPEKCAEFICGTIILFEKCFGTENKAAVQKILKEAMDSFGPDSMNQNIECMIPIYSMMKNYSTLSSVYEIFEKLYEKSSYRQYALFFVEWSRCHVDLAKKLEILKLGFRSKAEPLIVLKNEEKELLEMEKSYMQGHNIKGQHLCDRDLPDEDLTGESSIKRALLSEKYSITAESSSPCSERCLVFDFAAPPNMKSPTGPTSIRDMLPLQPTDSLRSSDENNLLLPDPNAENINPDGASLEPTVKRKHAGVLVAALDFVLEDYDLGDDSCVTSKSPEMLKREENEANIKNNLAGGEIGPSSSTISSCVTPLKGMTPSPTFSDNC